MAIRHRGAFWQKDRQLGRVTVRPPPILGIGGRNPQPSPLDLTIAGVLTILDASEEVLALGQAAVPAL
jgi:hypothetical protein